MWLPGVCNSISATLNHHKVTLSIVYYSSFPACVNPGLAAELCPKGGKRSASIKLSNSPFLASLVVFNETLEYLKFRLRRHRGKLHV